MPEALDPLPLLRYLHERGVEHMQWAGGIETDNLYAELNRAAVTGNVEDFSVRVCSLDHLCAMKRAAGRPQDLEDLRHLDGAEPFIRRLEQEK